MNNAAPFQCRLQPHGKHQIELKTRYPLGRGRRSRYRMDLYLFFPAQLRMNRGTYGVKGFLKGLQIYTRYSSPSLSLPMLIDPECELSPLSRIEALLAQPEEEKLLYELRMLVNIFRAETGAVVRLVKRHLSSSLESAEADLRVERFLKEIDDFLQVFRTLHEKFIDPRISETCRTALEWADESISLQVEGELFRLYELYEGKGGRILKGIVSGIERESRHRRIRRYPADAEADTPLAGERRHYRAGILKKWSQGALYMNQEVSETPRKVGHVLAGIAAAVAMGFAVAATVFAEKLFPSQSIPWALALVVSYIFKDRIKEVLRGILVKLMPRWVSDLGSRLIDPSISKSVGFSKGAVRFPAPSEVPSPVGTLRNQIPNPFRSILPREDVLHFRKTIRLNNRKLMDNHTRLEALTEILRIKVDPWLGEMDSPRGTIYTLREGRKAKLKGKRVYHVNMVIGLSDGEGGDGEEFFHYRLILNRNGLIRIEEGPRTFTPPGG